MKLNYILTITTLVTISFLVGCQNQQEETTQADDNSRTSIDWQGTYYGVVPCADCEGIETTLTLDNNTLTYQIKTIYRGKNDQVFERSGTFAWNNAGSTILLEGITDGPSQYLVGENVLIQLDMKGRRIKGKLADRYKLRKTVESVLAQYRWNLVELQGAFMHRCPAFIRFNPEHNTVNGYTWCNKFDGRYTLQDNDIRFLSMYKYDRMCADSTLETQLMNVFRVAQTYQIDGFVLSLSLTEGMPMAKFEGVNPRPN